MAQDDSKSETPAEFTAMAIKEQGGKFVELKYKPAPLGDNDVEIKVTHNGCCHSDLSMAKNEWYMTAYPFIGGHECVGIVTQTGKNFSKQFNKGDRVGFGWFRASCGNCKFCIAGETNLCKQMSGTIIGHHGGFSDYIRFPGNFVFKIPDGLPSAEAAPLLCAGTTVYAPLKRYIKRAGDRVGVVGIGGLGHLAIKFASKMGVYVTAFSSSNKKKEQAMQFGATSYVVSSNKDEMLKLKGEFSLIIVTANAKLDYNLFVDLLENSGVICFVGFSIEKVDVPVGTLLSGQKSVVGSNGGSKVEISQMLQFAATNKIYPKIETLPMNKIGEAFEKLEKNQARYRMVLVSDGVDNGKK